MESAEMFKRSMHESRLAEEMKKQAALLVLGLVLIFGSATRSGAQVRRVQMHIAGYLCGN
jgi:hypothetical protein